MKTSSIRIIIGVLIFTIALAFIESAVVVYLRALYYPDGFYFPLKLIDNNIAIIEILREAATVIILICIGIAMGRSRTEKFAYFLYSFAVWDIFYYVFLKLFLNWPESFFTWDILFLIPVTWVGPVIAPVINSLFMILLAITIIYFTDKDAKAKISKIEWILMIFGSLVIIYSYTEEYMNFMLKYFSFKELFIYPDQSEIIKYSTIFIPYNFNWLIFGAGQLMIFAAIILFYFRMIKETDFKTFHFSH